MEIASVNIFLWFKMLPIFNAILIFTYKIFNVERKPQIVAIFNVCSLSLYF